MAVSTKETAKELEKFVSNPGAEVLYAWMAAMYASLYALAEALDTHITTGTAGVDSISVEE
jgi:hypothetical protein